MRRRFRRATYPGGFMRRAMAVLPDVPTVAVRSRGHLIGWALVAPLPEGNHAMFFVNERYRGCGMARRLLANILNRFETVIVTHWDERTRRLFERWATEFPGRIMVLGWWSKRADFEESLAWAAVRAKCRT